MKKILTVILALFITGCSIKPNTNIIKKEKTFLGNTTDINNDMVLLLNTEIYLTTVNQDLKEVLINTAKQQIIKYHKLLDSHHQYYDDNNEIITNLSILNNAIGQGSITVDPIIIDAFKEAITLTKLTKGYFNITIGELSTLYQDKLLPYDTYNKDPNKEDIDKYVKGIIPYEKIDEYIIIDEVNNTIELKDNIYPYSIDLGAFSKGYIINRVYEELKKYNTSFLLNAGGSSIAAYTSEKDNTNWSIAIKNPEDIDNQLFTFSLNNGSISTSGDYEKYYYLEDKTKRHHILNPYTGYSENFYKSNTLLSDNAGIIDALSTALFNIEEEKELLEIIHDIEKYYNTDISFLYIQGDLNIFMDKSFNEKINILSGFTYSSTIITD